MLGVPGQEPTGTQEAMGEPLRFFNCLIQTKKHSPGEKKKSCLAPSDHQPQRVLAAAGSKEDTAGIEKDGTVCESHTEQEKPDRHKQLRFSIALK